MVSTTLVCAHCGQRVTSASAHSCATCRFALARIDAERAWWTRPEWALSLLLVLVVLALAARGLG